MSDRDTAALRETMAAIVDTAPVSPELPDPVTRGARPRRSVVSVGGPVYVLAGAFAAVVLIGTVLAVVASFGGGQSVTGTTQGPVDTVTTVTGAPDSSTTTLISDSVALPGMTWERVMDEGALEGTVWALAHNGVVVVAVGDDYNEDEGYNDTPNVVIWISTDGQSWQRIDDPVVFGGEGIQQAYQITAGPGGFVIAGEDVPNTVLWFSPDGYAWERVFDGDLGTPGVIEGLTVVAGGPGWIALDVSS